MRDYKCNYINKVIDVELENIMCDLTTDNYDKFLKTVLKVMEDWYSTDYTRLYQILRMDGEEASILLLGNMNNEAYKEIVKAYALRSADIMLAVVEGWL